MIQADVLIVNPVYFSLLPKILLLSVRVSESLTVVCTDGHVQQPVLRGVSLGGLASACRLLTLRRPSPPPHTCAKLPHNRVIRGRSRVTSRGEGRDKLDPGSGVGVEEAGSISSSSRAVGRLDFGKFKLQWIQGLFEGAESSQGPRSADPSQSKPEQVPNCSVGGRE